MAMNREQKRMMQRQGQVDADGAPVAQRQPQRTPKPSKERTSPPQFVREVRSEMRKVAWPTRDEVIHYSIIVLIAIVVMTAFIAAVDFAFGEAILWVIDR
ncbi:MAG: preprotein translocase subunit SecE [Acidimicrobiia bacterium]|nr:preprotein translocase subunit SecE [Acidimicrobiia bacterium]